MADKPAGSVEQSQQICLFTVRQCGTTAMTTGAGLDIYLVCWLMSLNHLNTLGGIFRHLPLSSEYSVSPMHVCVLYKHCGLRRTRPGRSVEGGSLQFGLFLVFKKPVLWTVFWPIIDKHASCFHCFCILWLYCSVEAVKVQPQLPQKQWRLPRPLAGKPSPALPVWAGSSPSDSLPVEFTKAF